MKTGILYFTTCFHGFAILRHVDPFVRMLHIYALGARGHMLQEKILKIWCSLVRFGVYLIILCLEKFPKN